MFEKIKNKVKEIATKIDQRFNLSGLYGPISIVTDIELSARVIGNKISKEWVKFADRPKEYLVEKFNAIKEATDQKIDETKQFINEQKNIKQGFGDRLASWFHDRINDVFYNIPEKVAETREMWEIEKLKVASEQKISKVEQLELLKRIEKLNQQRVEFKNKARKQEELAKQFRLAYAIN